ncbi:hypothetical protein [Melissococcus plutonius]|uniref:WxL domain-containing protein n=1 Tax=Melissococcus plutonius (strain ATCC 35311 / DSM 29964 / CIP 104052 / LMG 20360 / NCIMB 702443) TaxID=940190 RepID=F3YCQ9_MELPT|nr:hypothetical protein [Melissococcus plutonius]KMT28793.1 hypothetical protein MEPL6_13c00180 [Melissococcus plutonius]KMT32464.1 hypothetical protein MEPL8_13c00260 [Melissococcus plutonius]KMT38627.1 hypothetical protein MEPL12_10c00030 [Melissococcus plutonius]MBB5178295.1 hypothetical protein [Melissococcus plutonius]BAK22287.1 hypothetical protein MPTP_1896 [Melissococcus plutonius ATCC 35311]
MKKLLMAVLLIGSVVSFETVGLAEDDTEASNQQTVNGKKDADITVEGTLGADNKNPEEKIPEGSNDWINVTVPTKTIFYNTVENKNIQSPTYTIMNNSGRPVTVSATNFVDTTSDVTLPTDFDLNLQVKGNNPTSANTPLVTDGKIVTGLNAKLITLANNQNQLVASDPENENPVNNKATFTYGGTATVTKSTKLSYTLSLKFDAVAWQ